MPAPGPRAPRPPAATWCAVDGQACRDEVPSKMASTPAPWEETQYAPTGTRSAGFGELVTEIFAQAEALLLLEHERIIQERSVLCRESDEDVPFEGHEQVPPLSPEPSPYFVRCRPAPLAEVEGVVWPPRGSFEGDQCPTSPASPKSFTSFRSAGATALDAALSQANEKQKKKVDPVLQRSFSEERRNSQDVAFQEFMEIAAVERRAKFMQVKSASMQVDGRKQNKYVRYLTRVWQDNEQRGLLLDSVMGIVIILNSLVIGVSADVHSDWPGWFVVDCIFCGIYFGEMIAKMMMWGFWTYFRGSEWRWNLFDFVVVALALLEIILDLTRDRDSDSGGVQMSFFRIIRLARLLRMVKVWRIPQVRDLRMMISGAIGGLNTLLWSMVLIVFPLYVLAVTLNETLGRHDNDNNGTSSFATVGQSFFTLFRCTVGGDCTDTGGRPIFQLVTDAFGWPYALLYCITMAGMIFGLFNVIVAMFVENTMAAAKFNDEIMKRERLQDKRRLALKSMELVEVILELYKKLPDSPASAQNISLESAPQLEITQQLFAQFLKDQRVRSLFNELDVDESNLVDLFDVLDADGGGTLQLEEIVLGIAKLRGDARRSDVVSVGLVLRSLQNTLMSFENTSMSLLEAQGKALLSQSRQLRSLSRWAAGEGVVTPAQGDASSPCSSLRRALNRRAQGRREENPVTTIRELRAADQKASQCEK